MLVALPLLRAGVTRRGGLLTLLHMQLVHDPVYERREQHAEDGDEDNAGEERVDRGEDLRRVALEIADRTHAAEDHRGVEQRVDPGEVRDLVVADDAGAEAHGDDAEGEGEMAGHAPGELRARQKAFPAILVRVRYLGAMRDGTLSRSQLKFAERRFPE